MRDGGYRQGARREGGPWHERPLSGRRDDPNRPDAGLTRPVGAQHPTMAVARRRDQPAAARRRRPPAAQHRPRWPRLGSELRHGAAPLRCGVRRGGVAVQGVAAAERCRPESPCHAADFAVPRRFRRHRTGRGDTAAAHRSALLQLLAGAHGRHRADGGAGRAQRRHAVSGGRHRGAARHRRAVGPRSPDPGLSRRADGMEWALLLGRRGARAQCADIGPAVIRERRG